LRKPDASTKSTHNCADLKQIELIPTGGIAICKMRRRDQNSRGLGAVHWPLN
jgi:hypothetical protein